MYDNGLIEYYRQLNSREGFLNVKPLKIRELNGPKLLGTTVRCKSPYGYFFKKFNNWFSKDVADAEILLSQISSKLGLNSAIYTPAQEDDKLFLLSNDVWGDRTVPAEAFHEYISIVEGKPFYKNGNLLNFTAQELSKYFTPNALEQKIKMQLFDTASNNPDRSITNYFYNINENMQAEDVVLIDHERSGIEANRYYICGKKSYCASYFTSEFNKHSLSRQGVIDNVKENENNILENFDANKFANELGSINVRETALDITRNIGYVVNPDYVDYISSSYNNMAEMLGQ